MGLPLISAASRGAKNDPNFGVRIVNAATGADARDGTNTTALPSDTSANWRLDEVQVLGTSLAGSTAPVVTTNPANVLANGDSTASFTAAATGTPAPAVQWQVSNNGGTSYSNVSGATSTTYSFLANTQPSGSLFRAAFTNVASTATTTAATLTYPSVPTVFSQPTNQSVTVGSPVTFTATGFGLTAPTVTWRYSTDGGVTFPAGNNVSGGSYNPTTGIASYTFTPLQTDSGKQFEAIFASGGATTTTSPAVLTVLAPSITLWTLPNALTPPVTAPLPAPTVGSGVLTPIGMSNDYTGVQSVPVDDVTGTTAILDSTYTENLWRVRGGSGAGPTGSAGSPDGWSGFAPTGTQGAEFDVSTSNFQNIAVHFDWYSTTSGAKSAQPQYTIDGTHWINYGSPLTAASNDYYGDTSATAAPSGVTINLQNISGVNNNPNFAVRLVSVYQPTDYSLTGNNPDNALPMIYDGNLLITDGNGNPVAHGQYATADPTAGAFTSQEIAIGGAGLSGTFTLTIGGNTTAPINYDSSYSAGGTVSNLATAIQTALGNLTNIGSKNVTVTSIDGLASNFIITFKQPQTGAITATSNLTGSHNAASNTDPSVNVIYAGSLIPYTTTGTGNWRFGNISVSGDAISGAPGILTQPATTTVTLPVGGGTTTANFSATAYSETTIAGVQWKVSTNGGSTWSNVASGGNNLTPNGNVYTSNFSFTTSSTAQSGYEFEAIFTNGSGSATTSAATMVVVIPTAPTIAVTGEPISSSAIVGNNAGFTAVAIGLPLSGSSAVWEYSTNNGSTWTPVSIAGTTSVGTTITNLASGYQSSTSVLTLPAVLIQSGYEFEAVFTNTAGSATSTPATLTVLPVEPIITQWNFGGNSSTGIQSAPDNSPAANINTAPGTLSSIGFNDPNFPSVTSDDVTSTSGTTNKTFTENTWRIRGGATATAPGSPDNGWDYLAPQYTQGAEIDINTTGMQNIYVTFDWYQTAQGVRDLQEQYSTNTSASNPTWTNINPLLVAPNGGDFYGTTDAVTNPTGVLLDLTKITGANNNPNFGVRLVAAWDPSLPVITDSTSVQNGNSLNTPEPRGQYASATLVNGAPTPLNGSSGNWRFGNITVSGVVSTPAWLSPASITSGGAVWNAATETLTVTGAASIIGDPVASGDLPTIDVSGGTAQLTIDSGTTRTINIAGLSITGGGVVTMPAGATSHILIVAAGSGDFNIDSSSKLDLGNNYIDFQNATSSDGLARLGTITADLQSGFNNGLWSGSGITSSTAQNDATHLTAVGAIVNNGIYGATTGSLGTFDGINPGTYDVLLRYTYYGDANLDGRVDASDYSDIDSGFINGTVSGWLNGNFNYDGGVNGSDYTLIDNAFNRQGARLLAETAAQIAKPANKPSASWSTAYSTQSTASIADLWKHDKANTLAGTLLDLINQRG